ncbi:MAG TPA: ABC transporter ATP-binding protein [Burkholderiales bacterium]|nr:ABC transporter ATP-binding protein [Burkholderiales bacterium]
MPYGGDASIRVARVTHVFPGGLLALNDVTLQVDGGEFVSIVGPSGCGKTTLLNLIAGLVEVQEGNVAVANEPPMAGRRDVAYMLARDCLLPWRSALGNVMVGGEFRRVPTAERRKRAHDFLEKVGLRGFENHYPKALSHGMRQRVALARTFSLDSPILLMDEPFGALDAQTKLQLEDALLGLWGAERRTVVFITHDLAEAVTLADRVIVMSCRPGRILADIRVSLERPRSVRALQKNPRYHEIYAQVWTKLEEGLSETNSLT